MKRNSIIYAAISIAALFSGSYFALKQIHPPTHATAPAPPVAQLFSMSLADIEGKTQPLAQWKGKTLLINFWATWCAPCVEEMPALSAMQADIASKNIQIVGIGIDSPANIKQFSSKHNIVYPLYSAGMDGTELARQFGNKAGVLPFTALVGSDGQIKKTYIGRLQLDQLRKDLTADLTPHLASR